MAKDEAKGIAADKAVNIEKLKALQLTMDKIEKSYGKGSIMRLGDKPVDDVAAISSGSIALDLALGIGGSAVLYLLTFFAVGVATDYRYAYWAVLAGLTGAVAVAVERRTAT